jgi:hypothetical protein
MRHGVVRDTPRRKAIFGRTGAALDVSSRQAFRSAAFYTFADVLAISKHPGQ